MCCCRVYFHFILTPKPVVIISDMGVFHKILHSKSCSHDSGNLGLQNLIKTLKVKVFFLAYLASQAFTWFSVLWVPFLWVSPVTHLFHTFFSFLLKRSFSATNFPQTGLFLILSHWVYIIDLVNWFTVRIHVHNTFSNQERRNIKEYRRADWIMGVTKCFYHLWGYGHLEFHCSSCLIL